MTKRISKASTRKELKAHGVQFSKWAESYLNPKSETHGNATQSALQNYKCKNYSVASVIASQNIKKLRNLGMCFDELDGRGMAFWMKVLATKAMKGSYNETVDFMERLGYIPKKDSPQTQINQQFNLSNIAESFAQARKERGLPISTS